MVHPCRNLDQGASLRLALERHRTVIDRKIAFLAVNIRRYVIVIISLRMESPVRNSAVLRHKQAVSVALFIQFGHIQSVKTSRRLRICHHGRAEYTLRVIGDAVGLAIQFVIIIRHFPCIRVG